MLKTFIPKKEMCVGTQLQKFVYKFREITDVLKDMDLRLKLHELREGNGKL